MTDWTYLGDIDVAEGGMWLRLHPRKRYAETVQVYNLDSAVGADGLVLVSRGAVSWDYPKNVRSALSTLGLTTLKEIPRESRMYLLAQALAQYQGVSIEDYVLVVPEMYKGHKGTWGYWQPDREETIELHHKFGGDVESFVKHKFLEVER